MNYMNRTRTESSIAENSCTYRDFKPSQTMETAAGNWASEVPWTRMT
jgi:hypothetical protein